MYINIEGEIKKNTFTTHKHSTNTHTIGSSSLRFQYRISVDAELGPATYSVDVAQFFDDLHQISLIQSRHFFPKDMLKSSAAALRINKCCFLHTTSRRLGSKEET